MVTIIAIDKEVQMAGSADKHTNSSRRSILQTGGISEESFQNIYPNILSTNYDIIRIILIAGYSLFLFLIAIALIFAKTTEYIPVYISLFIILVLAHIVIKQLFQKYPKVVSYTWYLCAIIIYGYAIYMGTFLDPLMLGTVFCVLLVALPMLIIDRPYRTIIVLSAASIVFILCTFIAKSSDIAITDTVNVISFYVLALFINVRMTVIRIRELEQRLFIEHQRNTDYLTGLLTKSAFQDMAMQRAKEQFASGFFIIIDLDNFKRVNDLYGHDVGDNVIKQTADCIDECFGDSALKSRFGGDEFMVFLIDTSETELEDKIHKFLLRVPLDTILPNRNDIIYCSIGITSVKAGEFDYSTVFKQADTALYHSKRNGKNQSCLYTEAMHILMNSNV